MKERHSNNELYRERECYGYRSNGNAKYEKHENSNVSSFDERTTTTIHSKRFHNISTISNISIICPVYSIDKPTVMILASQPACLPVIVIPASV